MKTLFTMITNKVIAEDVDVSKKKSESVEKLEEVEVFENVDSNNENLPFVLDNYLTKDTENFFGYNPVLQNNKLLTETYDNMDCTNLSKIDYDLYVLRSFYYNYYMKTDKGKVYIPDKWDGIDMSVMMKYNNFMWKDNHLKLLIDMLKSSITDDSNVVFQSIESLHMTLFHSFRTNMIDEFGKVVPFLDMNKWQHVKIDLINLLTNRCTFDIIFKKIIITDAGAIILCGYPPDKDITKLQILRNQIKSIHVNHNVPTKSINNIFHMTIGKILPQSEYNEYNISTQNYTSLTQKITEINKTLKILWNPSTVSVVGSHSPILESTFTEVNINLKHK